MNLTSRLVQRIAAAGVGLALVLATPVVQASGPEEPMDPQAKAHLDRGFEAYRSGDYDRAIEELEKGYSIQPRAEFLFAWAQAARFDGRYEVAIEKYQAFIDAGATDSQIEAAQELIADCQAKLDKQREAERKAEEERRKAEDAAAAEAQPEPEPEPAKDTDWRRDPVAGVLVGTGAAALLGGVGLIAAAQVRVGALDQATTYDEFDQEFADAQSKVPAMRVAGSVLMVAGAGLIVGGIVRYGQKKRQARLSSAGVFLREGTAGVVLSGHF